MVTACDRENVKFMQITHWRHTTSQVKAISSSLSRRWKKIGDREIRPGMTIPNVGPSSSLIFYRSPDGSWLITGNTSIGTRNTKARTIRLLSRYRYRPTIDRCRVLLNRQRLTDWTVSSIGEKHDFLFILMFVVWFVAIVEYAGYIHSASTHDHMGSTNCIESYALSATGVPAPTPTDQLDGNGNGVGHMWMEWNYYNCIFFFRELTV